MLPQKRRMRRSEFPRDTRKGASFLSPHFSLSAFFRQKNSLSKTSVVVSSKTIKTATGRNLLKRRVYSLVKDLFPKLPLHASFLLFARKGSGELSFKELSSEIHALFSKIK